jgi:transaldolase
VLAETKYKSLLQEMTATTPTALWNDSCAIGELKPAIEENGAVGATCNPVIVLDVLKKEMHLWKEHIMQLPAAYPQASEDELGWRLVEDMSRKAAALLEPAFREHKGRNGRLSIQTDPRLYRNPEAMADQAEHFSALAPNMIVKLPVTEAGVAAIEEATARGVSINATVSFSVPQAIAVAEAVERGLKRREKAGQEISSMGPVCTIMVGRLDDWLKVVADREDIIVEPGTLEWAGVAAMKRAYALYRERGYRLRLLSAAFRNHLHWSAFIGGDVVISPPFKWQRRYNASDVELRDRMEEPVPAARLDELLRKFPDFRRAYEPDGMEVREFDGFGPTVRTLRQFSAACCDLAALIRDYLLPNPDKK